MTSGIKRWVLLVEDDPVFAMLFTRSWRKAYPEIALVAVASLGSLQRTLAQCSDSPSLVVLDRNLPDGDGHLWAVAAPMPTYCWSSCGEGGSCSKPMGLEQLMASVAELGARLGHRTQTESEGGL